MNDDNTLSVCHRTFTTGEPYFQVIDLPEYLDGVYADMTPEQARAYAHALLQAADECEALGPTPKDKRGVHLPRDMRRSYALQGEGCA